MSLLSSSCPCLIILDDLDDLCPHQDASPNELERKTMASISAQLDDLHRHPPPAHVVVLATTNQIERVEANLRRPGRFDKEVELPVPSASDRLEVCCTHEVTRTIHDQFCVPHRFWRSNCTKGSIIFLRKMSNGSTVIIFIINCIHKTLSSSRIMLALQRRLMAMWELIS